jgi:hypothetical protein
MTCFIQANIPYQAPGSLKEEEYWQLTAFVLRANGVSIGYKPLDRQTAARISLSPTTAVPNLPVVHPGTLAALGAAALLLVVLLGLLVWLHFRHLPPK